MVVVCEQIPKTSFGLSFDEIVDVYDQDMNRVGFLMNTWTTRSARSRPTIRSAGRGHATNFHLLADAALLLLDFAGAAIGLLDGFFLQRQSGGVGEKLIVRVAAS
jgi:hypothetical protein